jgi:hypothetical protein
MRALTFLLVLVFLAPSMRAAEEGWAVAIGDPAPQFALPDVEGRLHQLSDFSGRPVVLVFWGTW